jgi:hypothetical protein
LQVVSTPLRNFSCITAELTEKNNQERRET